MWAMWPKCLPLGSWFSTERNGNNSYNNPKDITLYEFIWTFNLDCYVYGIIFLHILNKSLILKTSYNLYLSSKFYYFLLTYRLFFSSLKLLIEKTSAYLLHVHFKTFLNIHHKLKVFRQLRKHVITQIWKRI